MNNNEITTLAELLVKYHNSITQTNASYLGFKMDKALCRDTFTTLYIRHDYETLKSIETKFAK